MDTKKVLLKGSFGNLLNRINLKDGDDKINKGKNTFSDLSNNIKSGIVKSIENKPKQISELIKSFKHEKIKNLEKLLKVERNQLIVSNRKNRIYRTEAGYMYIIDKDVWGEPVSVTIKDDKKVIIRKIKYLNNKPYLFPVFNEKNISGIIIHMNQHEIWYQDDNLITVVSFKGESSDIAKIKVANIKSLSREKLFEYINNYKIVCKNKKLQEIVKEKDLRIDDFLIITNKYIVGKDSKNFIKAYLFDNEYTIYDEIPLRVLPQIEPAAYDVLFSQDVLSYIRANKYNIEDFKQNGEYIEYWQNIGDTKMCVMRYKI
ncbi:MAG TPA: hypothetical protein PK566_00825 [Pseudobacteroides sp.]|nr:hypothetical protein [Pseudobacteroides sp.]